MGNNEKLKYILTLKRARYCQITQRNFSNDDVSLTFGVFLTQILSGSEKDRQSKIATRTRLGLQTCRIFYMFMKSSGKFHSSHIFAHIMNIYLVKVQIMTLTINYYIPSSYHQ